ncbi:enoyl-CoA hydratase/isomerase family protein [Acinetobacter larvae]|uniref:3-hydroxyisobutyryl-CoA hydrolase n=1 Tax=Acinetobacter larvae TaxID=1789224 RepID=A0A1B2LYS5_9GAMM|nr:enoyl-CoA hydratase/isomerase family protein [Acinetobacter larvae]AOA58039.1 enoyl-CoA hydratase [Acinetobacter larvae]
MTQQQHLCIAQHGAWGTIQLDRTQHLNALSYEMIQGIRQQLQHWATDDKIEAILISSNSPKAFCAGGDIRHLYDSFVQQTADYRDYFCAEYAMLDQLQHYSKPVVALLDGYVLGGGFGLANACHICVSTEKSRFAMPETAIGYFPDVGATYFLSRRQEVGCYMALSGEQISSQDALHYAFIDYLVESSQWAELQQVLLSSTQPSVANIRYILTDFAALPGESALKQKEACIRKHFSLSTVEDIEQSLAQEQDPADQAWAQQLAATLQQRSLLAKQVSLLLQHYGAQLEREDAMQLERDLQNIWCEQGDIIEGIRALIVDKDKNPQWQAANPALLQKTLQICQAYTASSSV